MTQADNHPSGKGRHQEDHPSGIGEDSQEAHQAASEDGGVKSPSSTVKKASRSPSNLLNTSIEKNLASIPNHEVKVNYAKAIVMATKLWIRDSESGESRAGISLRRPCSPELIRIETRFNYKDQLSFRILLKKTDAPEFLASMGKRISSKSSFKKSYSNDKASTKLDREAAALSGKMLVCTYAEWLYMEDFNFEPELPQVLFDLLPAGWKCPDPETPNANLPY